MSPYISYQTAMMGKTSHSINSGHVEDVDAGVKPFLDSTDEKHVLSQYKTIQTFYGRQYEGGSVSCFKDMPEVTQFGPE